MLFGTAASDNHLQWKARNISRKGGLFIFLKLGVRLDLFFFKTEKEKIRRNLEKDGETEREEGGGLVG